MKWFVRGLLFLVLALGVVLLLNATKIKRLMTVNSLFDADKIVHNFSNMDAAFLHHDLNIGDPQPWPESLQDLPETVTIAGEERALSEILAELDTTGLVVIKDGQLIHESYYKGTEKNDLRISWSVAKSFMSGLYGQALEQGLIESLDDPADKYVPSLKGSAYEGVSLANILNMSSGVVFNEDYMDPKSDINDMGRILGLGGSMDDYAATLKDSYYEPGTNWQYVSIDTHVAAMALRAVTGKSLHQLFEETYGSKLGFGKAPFYLTDGEDVAFALGGLNLRTRDYAKFGQLFLQEGKWKGEQLIPATWVKESTKNHAPVFHPQRGTGYGYQWWVPMPQNQMHRGDFFAVGIYGQYIYINPTHNVVIAKNATDREFTMAGKSGQTSIQDNIDMFRSLTSQISDVKILHIIDTSKTFGVTKFSLVDFMPLVEEDFKNWENSSNCICIFEKNGERLFADTKDFGLYKTKNLLQLMTPVPNSKNKRGEPYRAEFVLADKRIILEASPIHESDPNNSSSTMIGALALRKDKKTELMQGEVSCHC